MVEVRARVRVKISVWARAKLKVMTKVRVSPLNFHVFAVFKISNLKYGSGIDIPLFCRIFFEKLVNIWAENKRLTVVVAATQRSSERKKQKIKSKDAVK